MVTTLLLGEEGGDISSQLMAPSTMATGEEEPPATTMATGEEDGPKSSDADIVNPFGAF